MVRYALVFLFCALCACRPGAPSTPPSTALPAPAVAQDVTDDAPLVLPGTFSEQTTVTDLETRFGKTNVKIIEQRGTDDARWRSVVLFADDPGRRALVSFHDSEALKGLQSISVNDTGSRWRGKHGVRVGMSFADLRRINGKPFFFDGFDSEHRGGARDQWSPAFGDDATLGALDVDGGDHMYFGVDLGLRGDIKDVPGDAYPHDQSISSDDPRYPRLGELVVVTAINASTSLDDEWD